MPEARPPPPELLLLLLLLLRVKRCTGEPPAEGML
jgi:hypothetical protein